jgi:tetratricopeptide (TPR) repeat protein
LVLAGFLAAPSAAGEQGAVTAGSAAEADALYAARANLPSGIGAAAFWAKRISDDADDFEAGWKLARVCYWLGSHGPAAEQRARFEQGIEAARVASRVQPSRPEGHFWTAANMGAMAEAFGRRAGLRYRAPIKASLERALALDPAYLDGGADRALGRWYAKVPRLFGGSDAKAVEHLQRSLAYAPNSIASRFFLAETFLDTGRKDDARRELRAVLAAALHPDWIPEEREYKQKAEAHLARLR